MVLRNRIKVETVKLSQVQMLLRTSEGNVLKVHIGYWVFIFFAINICFSYNIFRQQSYIHVKHTCI